ncbi:hypothetical protein [Chromobacterium piscinae]|uniref:hypothetical protein n=1 Tax=Chromobacterium piscinae TaxID=686831 RepID=UPI003F7FD76B
MSVKEEFSAIKDDSGLTQFLTKHGFVEDEAATAKEKKDFARSISSGVLGIYSGQINGQLATITYTWRDQSRTFDPQPDLHTAVLFCSSLGQATVAFEV